MKTLILYDSVYGNTEKIAQAIGAALPGEVQVQKVGPVLPGDLGSLDLLILGSPTRGGLPTEAMRSLMERIGAPAHQGARAVAFDTRLTWGFLPHDAFAALKIADSLKAKGWRLAAEPQGFFVKGPKKGPLKRGELERATAWAKGLVTAEGSLA
jgi:flavodoxin I